MPIMMAIRIKLNVGVRRTADGPWGCGGIRAHAVLWMDGRPRIPFEWGGGLDQRRAVHGIVIA